MTTDNDAVCILYSFYAMANMCDNSMAKTFETRKTPKTKTKTNTGNTYPERNFHE